MEGEGKSCVLKTGVLVHSGCYNKMVVYNSRNVFLTIVEARKSKIKVAANLVSGKKSIASVIDSHLLSVLKSRRKEGIL